MSRAVVLVYSGDSSWELTSTIHHFSPRLPEDMIFQIFYSHKTLSQELEKIKTIYPRKFILSRMNSRWVDMLRARDTTNNFYVRTVEFWRQLAGERVLFIQIDSVICSKSRHRLQDFMRYDYIGAPWPYDWLIGGNSSYHIPQHSPEFFGGNGGLSIRSRDSMVGCSLAALNGSYPHPDGFAEDVFFSSCLKYFLKSRVLPGQEIARKFSLEAVRVDEKPWGCQRCWKFHSVDYLIRTCPDAVNSGSRDTAKMGSSSVNWISFVNFYLSSRILSHLTGVFAALALCGILWRVRRRRGNNNPFHTSYQTSKISKTDL